MYVQLLFLQFMPGSSIYRSQVLVQGNGFIPEVVTKRSVN